MTRNMFNQGAPPGTPNTPLPPTPLPPFTIQTFRDVLKIVTFVIVWYVTNDANHALIAAVDYARVAAQSPTLLHVSFSGAQIGLLQGAIMAVQALAVIWASPTLFYYLGPVLSAAFVTPIKLLADFKHALSSKATVESNTHARQKDDERR